MMPGYWNRPAETAKAFTDDGWYRTGDLASVDAGGYIFIVDRAKDMIVTGGENVYTTEVENALAGHPAVLELAVFGVPDEQWGEAVHAEVVLKPGAAATEAELIDHCRALDRRLQGAAIDHDPRRAAAQVGRRQDPQARDPAAVLGGPDALDLMCSIRVVAGQTGSVKELLDDLDRWRCTGKRVAVARVVDIEGSGPRDPGAAMAVSIDGEVVGSVSGGCVEGAVVTEALSVLGRRAAARRRHVRVQRRRGVRSRSHLRRHDPAVHRGTRLVTVYDELAERASAPTTRSPWPP